MHAPPPALGQLIELTAKPLEASAFSDYGQVIKANGPAEIINARLGRPAVHLYHAKPRHLSETITLLERHPLGSQLFMPLDSLRYIVVVAHHDGKSWDQDTLRGFVADGVGINLKRGVWHCPLFVIGRPGRFLFIDRIGPGDNLETSPAEVRVKFA